MSEIDALVEIAGDIMEGRKEPGQAKLATLVAKLVKRVPSIGSLLSAFVDSTFQMSAWSKLEYAIRALDAEATREQKVRSLAHELVSEMRVRLLDLLPKGADAPSVDSMGRSMFEDWPLDASHEWEVEMGDIKGPKATGFDWVIPVLAPGERLPLPTKTKVKIGDVTGEGSAGIRLRSPGGRGGKGEPD